MRIAFVIHDLEVGGAQKQLVLTADGLAERGFQVQIFTLSAQEIEVIPSRVEVVCLDCSLAEFSPLEKLLRLPSIGAKIRAAVSQYDPDLVLGFMTQTSVLLGYALRRSGRAIAACERVYPSYAPFVSAYPPRALFRTVRNRVFQKMHSIVVQSESAKPCFPAGLQSRIRVIPNIIPFEMEEREAVRTKRIVCAARFVPQKNLSFLIKAFAVVHEAEPEWELHLFGRGPEEEMLRELSRKLGLSQSVVFRGVVYPLDEEARSASVAALTSRYEGFPNWVAEAMRAGLPVAAVRCPGAVDELVREAETGFLSEQDDMDSFIDNLLTLIRDQALASRFGEAGRERLRTHFSESSVLDRWVELLESV